MSVESPNAYAKSFRFALALIGGYFATAGYIAFVGVALTTVGLTRIEAVTLAYVTGLGVFVVLSVWAIATRRILRTTALIGVTSAVLVSAALFLSSGAFP